MTFAFSMFEVVNVLERIGSEKEFSHPISDLPSEVLNFGMRDCVES